MNPTNTILRMNGMEAVPTANTTAAQVASAINSGWKPTDYTIDASRLGNVTKLPQFTPSYSSNNMTIPAPTGSTLDVNGFTGSAPTTAKDTLTKLAGLGDKLSTQGDVRGQLEQQQQLQSKNDKAIVDYNAYNKAKIDQVNTIEQMQNENPSGQFGGAHNAQIQRFKRESDAHIANLAYQSQISQGAFESAQAIIKSKMEAQFQPIKDQIDFYSKYYPLQTEAFKTSVKGVVDKADEINTLLMQNNAPVSVFNSVDKVISDFTDGKITAQQAKSQMAISAGTYAIDQSKEVLKLQRLQTIQNMQDKTATSKNLAVLLTTGDIPPSLISAYGGSRNEATVEADRISMENTGKHFNAEKAETDYQAAKRFASSLNGPQVVRYQVLANSVVNTIDEVNNLAEELKLRNIPLVNKAQLATYINITGSSSENGQLAARYLAAVNTVKEEFANLANGGYAPTDAAWTLANQQINENYDVNKLKASLFEVKRLINYRTNAFSEIKPITTGQSITTDSKDKNTQSTYLIRPDGKRRVDVSKLTPAQIEEAKNAGWK